jgi:hypothetical protein
VSSRFDCPACGGPLELRAEGATETLACPHCGAVLNARDPRHQILARYRAKLKVPPAIPIGARGVLRGLDMQVVGFQRRAVRYSGVIYGWEEYLLWNPYRGYRWLVQSDGHWLLMKTVLDDPQAAGDV